MSAESQESKHQEDQGSYEKTAEECLLWQAALIYSSIIHPFILSSHVL